MRCYRFDGFEVDLETGRLWRGQEEVALRYKCRQLLLYFLAHPQEQVTRDTLVDAIWQGDVHADAALSKTVGELRRALGDDPKAPRFVETLPKLGYRWMTAVSLGEREHMEPTAPAHVEAAERPTEKPSPLRWALPLSVVVIAFVMLMFAWFLSTQVNQNQAVTTSRKQLSAVPIVVILPFVNQTDESAKDWLELGLPDYIGSIHNEAQHLDVVAVHQVDKWMRAHELELPLPAHELTALKQSFSAQAVVWATVSKGTDGFVLDYGLQQQDQPSQAATLQGDNLIKLSEQLAQVIHEALLDVPYLNFNHAIYAGDSSITQRYIEARMFNYAGQLHKAKARYKALVALAPDFVWAKMGLASVMFSLGEFNAEFDQLVAEAEVQAKEQGSKVAQTMVMQLQAVRAKAAGNAEEALHIFQAMLNHPYCRDQDRAQVHLNMGAIYGGLGQYDKERASYQRAIALGVNPYDRALILNNLGAIATEEGRYAEGRRILEQALALNRRLNELNEAGNNLLELGKNAKLAGQLEAGADFFTSAIELFQRNQNVFYEAEAWIGLGNCTRQLEQSDQAMEHYVKARSILEKPAFAALPYYEKDMLSGLYARMARVEAERGKPEQAQQLMQKAIEAFDLMGNAHKAQQLREELQQWQQQTAG